MMLPSRGLGSALLMLTLALAPLAGAGCGDDLPDLGLDGGNSASTSQGTTAGTGPVTTMVTSADTTVGSMSDSMGSTAGTSSSSGEPGSTTQGVSATTMGDGTGTTTGDGTTSGSTSDATTSAVTSGMTSGATSGMTSGATGGMTSVATDFSASTSGDLGGTTDFGTTSGGTTGGTTDMTGGATDDGATGGMTEVPDFTGDFLFVVATPLDPTLPFQYIANFDYVPSGFGGGTVDVELQPLALDTGSSTTPRTFFGPPLVFPAIPVTPDGTFAIPVGILNVAAETNPLFFIDAQANNVIFSLQVLDVDDLCGTVTGFLVFPVASPLDGTTIGAVRVADIMPAGLPLVFPTACP